MLTLNGLYFLFSFIIYHYGFSFLRFPLFCKVILLIIFTQNLVYILGFVVIITINDVYSPTFQRIARIHLDFIDHLTCWQPTAEFRLTLFQYSLLSILFRFYLYSAVSSFIYLRILSALILHSLILYLLPQGFLKDTHFTV
jgi:hypothetical protein